MNKSYTQVSFLALFLLVFVLICVAPIISIGQYSLTTTTYSQNFDGLGNNATNTCANGDLSTINTSLKGWFFSESGSNANTTITTNTGSSTTGDTYNYGLTGNSNRSLGGLQTSSLNPTYGFYFTNNTGSTITSLAISYTGEVWREGNTGRTDEIDFQYSSSATSLTTGTWTAFTALNYQDTASTTVQGGSLLQSASISSTITGLNIANGTTFFIRWLDFDASGADDGMSVDNFSFTAGNTGSSPTVTLSTQDPAAANINVSSTNNIIAIYEMVATNATITPTGALFTTAGTYATGGTDISTFAVYQNTIPSLAGATSLGLFSNVVNSGTNIQVLSGFLSIPSGTVSYFIIAVNVASGAVAGRTVSIGTATASYNFSFAGPPVVAGNFPLSASNTFTIATGAFTSDRLAVMRIGNGTSLSSSAENIAIWQYNTSGTGQSGTQIATMPTTAGIRGMSGNRALTQSGTATSEGLMNLSGNGRYLTLVGYNAAPGTSSIASSAVERVVGLVSQSGVVNTTTTYDSSGIYSGNNIRSAYTPDGYSGVWTAGPTGGIYYVPVNSTDNTTAPQLANINARGIAVFYNQLYLSSATGGNYLSTVGTGTPTSGTQTVTNLQNFPTTPLSPYGYVFLNLPGATAGVVDSVLYVTSTNTVTGGGLYKFYRNATGNWINVGAINTTYSYFGITGTVNCSGTIDLYVTYSTSNNVKPTTLIKLTDAAAYNAAPSYTTTVLSSTLPTNYEFGGVCFTPMPDTIISTAGQTIPAGTYRNITIATGGSATLLGDITLLGTLAIDSAGTLDCSTYHVLSATDFQSLFNLQSGGTVQTAESNGLAATSYTGSIQTCSTRTYSTGGNYIYEATGSQITGDGVPGIVKTFTINNTSNTSLTKSISITNNLTIEGSPTIANLTINGKTLTLNGDLINNGYGTFTGSSTSNMVVNGTGNLTGHLIFAGGTADSLDNFTLNRTGTATMGSDLRIDSLTKLTAGQLAINGFSLTLDGTLDNTVGNTGTFTGDASATGTSQLTINGSGNLLGNLTFTSGSQLLENFTLNRSSSGIATLGSNLSIGGITSTSNSGTATMTAGQLVLNGDTLNLNGYVTGSGTFAGSASSVMTIGGNLSTNAGIINFTSGSQLLKTITINRWNGTTPGNAVTLGTNLTLSNLNLTYGVLSTGYNLLTLSSYANLSAPSIPWTSGSTTFGNSYVATCDTSGTPIAVAGNTTPLTSSYGFQINNIGTGGTTGDVYFPVGASFSPAATGFAPTPNRVSINNQGPADNFNIVVNYGDIDNTPDARVNRIWYINSANSTATSAPDKVTMKLFFIDRSYAGWPTTENEIENEPVTFDYTNIALVEKDYSATDPNFIAISGGTPYPGDIQDFPQGSYNNEEVYAQYSVGVSPDVSGAKNGIYQFNRFSITSPAGIILPVKVITFRAYQQGSGVQTAWTSLNEEDMAFYEVQRSADAVDFTSIGNVAAINNGQPSLNYLFYDSHPLQGDNYYRLRIIGKNGSISYSNTQVVVIGGGASGINIFPNPVTQYSFTLQLNNIPSGKYTLAIYNSIGQQVLNQEINHAGGSASEPVYLPSGIAKGEYHVKLHGIGLQMDKMITVE